MVLLYVVSSSYFNIQHCTLSDLGLFTFSSVVEYLAQYFKSLSYKYGDASVVTPFIYSQAVFMLAADIFIFGYQFSFFDVSGGILVTASLLTPIIYKLTNQKY